MMRKIAFFDLDGTLCSGGDLHVSLEIKQAFQSMRENEIEPVIATGRSFLRGTAFTDVFRSRKLHSV